MSYTTHNFQPGWSLTADQLNDMDEAIATLFSIGAGKNGLSMWVSNLEFNTTINELFIQIIEGREIQVGDLILFNDGIVGKVIQTASNNVAVEDTGINLKAVLSDEDKEALKTEIIDDILGSIEIAEGSEY